MKTLNQISEEILSRPRESAREPYYLPKVNYTYVKLELASLGGISAFHDDKFFVSGAPVLVDEKSEDDETMLADAMIKAFLMNGVSITKDSDDQA